MIAVRMLAGAFGGPLSSLSVALIADWVPPAERGRAMGKVMQLTLSVDHRVIDGAAGAAFLATLKSLIEEPELLFA